MDWASSCDSSCPGLALHQSRRLTPFRLLGDARQAVVKLLRFDGNARIGNRARPEQAAEARWHCRLVFPQRYGGIAVDASGCVAAPRLCALPLLLGGQYHCRIGCSLRDLVQCRVVFLHRYRGDGLRELPIQDPSCPHPPSNPPPAPTHSPLGSLCHLYFRLLTSFPFFSILRVLLGVPQLVADDSAALVLSPQHYRDPLGPLFVNLTDMGCSSSWTSHTPVATCLWWDGLPLACDHLPSTASPRPTKNRAGPANNRAGPAQHIVGAPDILGQVCPSVSPKTPRIDVGAEPLSPRYCCRLFQRFRQLHQHQRWKGSDYARVGATRQDIHQLLPRYTS